MNAMPHSRSEKALVGVTQDDGSRFVQVQDWGIGLDPASIYWTKRVGRK